MSLVLGAQASSRKRWVPAGTVRSKSTLTSVRRLQMYFHQGSRGHGRNALRFSRLAVVQAAHGVQRSSRWTSAWLWCSRNWFTAGFAEASVWMRSAAKKVGKRFCQNWCNRSTLPLACGVGAYLKEMS